MIPITRAMADSLSEERAEGGMRLSRVPRAGDEFKRRVRDLGHSPNEMLISFATTHRLPDRTPDPA